MGFAYIAQQDAQAISTAVDIFHITIADDVPIQILSVEAGQTTDLGDAAEEVLRVGIYKGVTGGGGGTALTETGLHDRAPTAGTAVVGQGTASTGGTLVDAFNWNIRQAGPIYLPTPELLTRLGQGSSPVAMRLLAAPADSITTGSLVLKWYEL